MPEEKDALHFETSNSKGEGLAVLRDAANETVLYLDYGPGSTGHNHPSKLNVVLYAGGNIRFVDPGRLAYGNPMHEKWFRQTVAHNTVVVNGKSQKRGPGTLKAFAATKDFDVVRATCDTAYDGVTLDRTILRRGDLFFDVFRCRAEEESVFDLPLHLHGDILGLKEGKPAGPLGEKDGYPYIKDIQELERKMNSLHLDLGKGKRLAIIACSPADCYTGNGYATASLTSFDPLLLRRVKGKTADFVTVYQVVGSGERDPIVRVSPQDPVQVAVGNLRLSVGDTTRVTLSGHATEVYDIGPEGATLVSAEKDR